MKKLLVLFLGGLVFSSCNNPGSSPNEAAKKDSATNTVNTQKLDYPYTIDHPDNWDIGSQQNTLNVLKSLKAWENKNIDESIKYFADSIHIQFDGIDKTVPNDTLKAMFNQSAATTKSWLIKMQDWESVISRDKNDEYVTLWYRQYRENMKGIKDSVDIINDLKMKDGKIIGLDEYTRKLH